MANYHDDALMNEHIIPMFLWLYAWYEAFQEDGMRETSTAAGIVTLPLQITVFMMVLYSSYISL